MAARNEACDLAGQISGAENAAGFDLANRHADRCRPLECRSDRGRRDQNGGTAVDDLIRQRRVSHAKESQLREYPADCDGPTLIRRLTALPDKLCWLRIEENGRSYYK